MLTTLPAYALYSAQAAGSKPAKKAKPAKATQSVAMQTVPEEDEDYVFL
jgi:hypothetical protein